MEQITKQKSAQVAVWAFVILMLFVVFGLYGLPFLSSSDLGDDIFVDSRNAKNTFELMEKVFDYDSFKISNFFGDENAAYRDVGTYQLLKTTFQHFFAAGIVYWVMLLPLLFLLINATARLLFGKGLNNLFGMVPLFCLSAVNLILFVITKIKFNMVFDIMLSDYYSNAFFYHTNTVIIFVCSFFLLVFGVLQTVAERKGCLLRVPVLTLKRNVEATRSENADSAQNDSELDALDFAKDALFQKADRVTLGQSFAEVVRTLGKPKFTDDKQYSYWWRNSRSLEEYQLCESASLGDRQIKIGFDQDENVKSVYYNADATPYRNKQLEDEYIIDKKESYSDNIMLQLAKSGVEMSFTDGSFIKKLDVMLEIGKNVNGECIVRWHTDDLLFSDTIHIR